MEKFNKAFTLVELLVVVLIIGILAAIAVPQYQLAVDKTHLSKLQIQVKSIKSAFESYYLAHNEYPSSFATLDIDFPSTLQKKSYSDTEFYIFPDYYCGIGKGNTGSGPIIYCGMNDYSFAYHYDYNLKYNICVAANENERAQRVCKSLKYKRSSSGWDLITPYPYYYNNNGKKYTYYFLE